MLKIRIEGFEEITQKNLDFTRNIPILPEPQKIEYSNIFKKVSTTLRFSVFGIKDIKRLDYHIHENFDSKNRIIEVKVNSDNQENRTKSEDYTKNSIECESYSVHFEDERYEIAAETETGLFYGLVSLSQLIFRVQNGIESFDAIEVVTIEDYPIFELRGASEQICHGQVPNLQILKTWIKYMARYKSNILILNLEDVIGFDKYPEIGLKRGALTKEEISELSDYANLYYCELVPGFQCLGHLENFLFYDEFRDFAEFPGGNSLDISNPKTYELLEYFYTEICKKFSSKFVHIEMDEAYDFGLFKSKQLIEKEGRANVLLNHIMKIHDLLVNKLGKTILMYHDTLITEPNIISKIPKDIKIIFWNYSNTGSLKALRNFSDAGLFTIVSPSIINWTRPFPYLKHGFKNMQLMADIGIKSGCKGYLNSAWGDYSNENFIALNIIPLSFGCYLAWNPKIKQTKPKQPIGVGATMERYKWAFSRDFLKYDYFNAVWDLFELVSSFNSGGPWNNTFFIELWMHPFDGYPRGNIKIAKQNIKKMRLAQEYFNLLSPNLMNNAYIMNFVKYTIEIVEFQAEKILYSSHLHKRWKKPDCFISKSELPRIQYMIENLESLKEKYCTLWNFSSKPQGLERIIKNFDHSLIWFNEIKRSIKEKRVFKNGPLEQNNQQPFIFKKQFIIPTKRFEKIRAAFVQGIANTYLKIIINGKEVGEVISRFYLSPVIYDNSVQIFDIKSFMKPEMNVIEVHAQEFTFSFVAINVLLDVFFEEIQAKLSIQSDSSWAYCDFNSYSAKNPKWKVPKIYGKPPKLNGPIYKPDLLNRQPSTITREFGQLGYMHSMVLNRTKSIKLANLTAFIMKIKRGL
jgi:hypothetical protein